MKQGSRNGLIIGKYETLGAMLWNQSVNRNSGTPVNRKAKKRNPMNEANQEKAVSGLCM